MASIVLSDLYGHGLDMSGFNDEGWSSVTPPPISGQLMLGENAIVFEATGIEEYNTVEWDYYYDGSYVLIRNIIDSQNFMPVLSMQGVNILTKIADLNAPSWLIRFNQENDTLVGNNYDDYLKGGYGGDVLIGNAGNDSLFGNAGDDFLEGGFGNDLIVGGDGQDAADFAGASTNYLFTKNADGSVAVTDMSGVWGTDLLYSVETLSFDNGFFSVSSLVPADPQPPVLEPPVTPPPPPPPPPVQPTDPFTGDDRSNTIVGNADNNVLKAFGGNDRVIGGTGSEHIFGGTGKDFLSGGTGRDVFVFDTKLGSYKTNRKLNFDTISDFNVRDDNIQLDNAVFKKLGKGSEINPTKLNKAFFTIGAQAEDRNDYLIYNNKTGVLSYDADGSGAGRAVEFAQLKKNLKMTYADIYVI